MPDALTDLLDSWQLTVLDELEGPRAELRRVRTVDGREAVFKLAEPTGWHAGQVASLKAWHHPAVSELLRAKPSLGAQLLEPLEEVWPDDEELARAVAQLWRELHVPAPVQVPRLAEVVLRELDALQAAGRAVPLPPRMVQQAVASGRRLAADEVPEVMLHGALGREHVMVRPRTQEPVAIAPLGLAGDEAAEMAAWCADAEGSTHQVQEHFWLLVDTLAQEGVELDEHRARDWTVVLTTLRAAAAVDRRQATHLVRVVKAISALQVTEA